MSEDNREKVPADGPERNADRSDPLPGQSLRMLRRLRKVAWLAVLALILAVSGYAGWRTFGPAVSPTVKVAGQALVKSEFDLVDHHGNRVTEEDFAGRWQLVFFGFTYCPDVCPTTLATIAEVLDTLGTDADQVAPLFITVDPERDTPAVMAEYVAVFHPKLIGLTGTPEQIEAAAKSFRVYYAKAEEAGAPDGYLMAHSGYIYLMTPDGEYDAVFTENFHPPKEIAADIEKRLAGS